MSDTCRLFPPVWRPIAFLPVTLSVRRMKLALTSKKADVHEVTCPHSELWLWYMLDMRRRRQWQPTLVLLPGKSHGRRSLVGYSPLGRKESNTTEWLHFLYQLSHKGSPRTLKWVAYAFCRRSPWPRNWIRVSRITGGFFTNWAIREVMRESKIDSTRVF